MITAIIQARMRSTRLPNKVLLPLGGKTILENVVERARQAKLIDQIVLATSTEPADDIIANLCAQKGIDCFRGSENDVLDRFYQAALFHKAENICRLTADCPLIDPAIIDKAAQEFLSGNYDYVSTSHPVATYPDGFDTWIFSFAALARSWQEAKLPSEREHVTSYIWNHPEKFKISSVKNEVDLSAYRLTIDEPADYELLKLVVAGVKNLTLANIMKFLETHAQVCQINADIIRDAGYGKSLLEDK
jgi:spore coat polysaccharide biosynthesis protein SpsF